MDRHVQTLQNTSAAKIWQINNKRASDDIGAETLQELEARHRGSARGQKIINHQNLFTRFNGVFMDFHHRFAIFQCIGL